MTNQDESGGVGALVRHTAGMAELAIHAGHPDRKHNEYLPYPDNNFNEIIDESFLRGLCPDIYVLLYIRVSLLFLAGKFTMSHIHDRSGGAFIPNIPIQIKSIDATRTYAAFTEFLNPYL
jgi:hypothetical protein